MINRRGFLGGIGALLASPKSLFTSRAGGYISPARFTSKLVSVSMSGSDIVPAMLPDDCNVLTKQEVENGLTALKTISSVSPKVPYLKVFSKNDVKPYSNSEDASIVSSNFGVSIYTDPSGVFTTEK